MLKHLKPNKFIKAGISAIILCAVFLLPKFALALDWGEGYGSAIGLGTGDPRIIAVGIIRVVLTFIGIIAVALIMYSGWLWMTSEGNETKVDQAKRTLKNAVIGLIIIMSAFAIVTFIFNKLTEVYGGGTGAVSEPPAPDWGLGALGSCTIKSVYPEPYQEEVPRNTNIIVTFMEEVDPTTICDDAGGNNDGNCDSGEYIIPENVRIFRTSTGDGCPFPCTGNILEVNVATSDNKTFIFMPVNYLGSPSEYIWYTVYLSNNILKLADSSGVFDTCGTDYFQWEFEVSNRVDLTPPQVKEGGVFPVPDNEADEVGTVTPATQATGNITVDSQPDVYTAATAQNPPAIIGLSENAAVSGEYICQEDGTITVSINGGTNQSDVSGPIGVVSGDDITDNIASLGCGLTLTPDDGTFTAGDSWTIAVTAEVQADTLTVGSIVYTFVNVAPVGNQIQLGAGINGTASNIAAALAGHPDVDAASALNVVAITAKVAGEAGNNIVLSSASGHLTIAPMSGGQDIEITTTVKDMKDKPRNAAIQINFNESINPMTVSGNADDVENYIRVVNADGGGNSGAVCAQDSDCLSYQCSGTCVNDYLAGKFVVSNQYRTVEFISDDLCGVNGCGEQIYCLPGNSHLKIELIAAGLTNCPADIDCGTVAPFTNCNVYCQNIAGENYPLSAIPLSGIADTAMNSLDGDRSEDAEGPAGFYNENIAAGPGDNYQWSFFISDQIDLSPPEITLVDPAHNTSGISLIDPILINFSKVMMSSSLSTGSTVIFNGKDYVTHQLINLWNFTGQPVGYWIANENIDDAPLDGEPDWTQAQIKHSSFVDSTNYRAQAGSGIKDIYQNCFKPSTSATCVGAPSCCGDVPSGGDSCP